jgi:hypothetical protein
MLQLWLLHDRRLRYRQALRSDQLKGRLKSSGMQYLNTQNQSHG